MIKSPGIYNIRAAEYHADPVIGVSLSSGVAKLLVMPGGSPLHAWTAHPRLNPEHVSEDSERFDLGSAAHALILGDPQKFAIIDAPDWRTKDAKLARENAREHGLIPVLHHQWLNVVAMATSAQSQLELHADASGAFQNGKPELTIIWDDGGVMCRARLDWLPDSGNSYDDYKSTGASADADCWSRTMLGMGADFQAAFYLRGVRKLGICDRPQFRFIVQENYPPYALNVIAMAPAMLELAERNVERALNIWRECRESNKWSGYPRRTCYIDLPPWREAQMMEREYRSEEISQAARSAAIKAGEPL